MTRSEPHLKPDALEMRAPKRGLTATISTPSGHDIMVMDGETFVTEVPDGQPPRRRMKLRVMTDTHVATVEVEPSVLMGASVLFANEHAIAEIPQQVELRLRHEEADRVEF